MATAPLMMASSDRSMQNESAIRPAQALDRFFAGLPETVDPVIVTGPGPYYAALADLDRGGRTHRDFDDHIWLAVAFAQHAVGRVRTGGTLLFIDGTVGAGLRRTRSETAPTSEAGE